MPRFRSILATAGMSCVALVAGCTNEIVWQNPPAAAGGVWATPVPTVPPGVATSGPVFENPVLVPSADHEFVWECVADAVDDYFRIKDEQPVRLVGQVVTEGRLETFPEVSATIFEPWCGDSVGRRQRIESTLQSMRRYAILRVIPDAQGYWIEVSVYKELEDVDHPDYATAGEATFRSDATLTRVVDSLRQQDINEGWIPKGRDPALEQKILAQILSRTGSSTAYPM